MFHIVLRVYRPTPMKANRNRLPNKIITSIRLVVINGFPVLGGFTGLMGTLQGKVHVYQQLFPRRQNTLFRRRRMAQSRLFVLSSMPIRARFNRSHV